ncbi:MAG: hypothetical protein JW910_03010, partial [Anaerolineae bacterium]|nr:hypothetical protein [Anaerolineae bacterium]
MRTLRKTEDDRVSFIMAGLDPAHHEAARGLVYTEHADGFAKSFPVDSPHLDQIYDNFSRHAGAMVLQAAHAIPIPWQEALAAFLRRVDGQGIDWYLVGSAALAVRGMPVTPGDLDLVTDGPGAHQLADLLADQLVE